MGESHFYSTKERLHGVREALERAGLGLDPRLVRVSEYTESAGAYEATVDLLRRPDPPTAVFAFNDRLAFGVLQAAHELRVPVPEALSVVGFDDLELRPIIVVVHPRRRRSLSLLRGRVGCKSLSGFTIAWVKAENFVENPSAVFSFARLLKHACKLTIDADRLWCLS